MSRQCNGWPMARDSAPRVIFAGVVMEILQPARLDVASHIWKFRHVKTKPRPQLSAVVPSRDRTESSAAAQLNGGIGAWLGFAFGLVVRLASVSCRNLMSFAHVDLDGRLGR